MMHNLNIYLPNIYQSISISLSLSLFKRRAIQNENLTDFVKCLATELPEPIEFYFF